MRAGRRRSSAPRPHSQHSALVAQPTCRAATLAGGEGEGAHSKVSTLWKALERIDLDHACEESVRLVTLDHFRGLIDRKGQPLYVAFMRNRWAVGHFILPEPYPSMLHLMLRVLVIPELYTEHKTNT